MIAEYSTIYVANPTSIFREIDSEQFDLVYLDPPYFESNGFTKRDAKSPYHKFEEYLQYTTGIILQSHRVLKANGSILVRNSPLSLFNARLFLDRIFGKRNYRAEIIWGRRIIRGLGGAVPHANFDNVFFYSKSDDFTYHELSQELSKEEIKRRYKHNDSKGLYTLWPLIDNVSRPNASFEWEGFKPPKDKTWKYSKFRLLELNRAGEIEKSGKFPRRKIYLTEERTSTPLGFVWDDFPEVNLKNNQFDLRIQSAIEMVSSSNATILSLFTDLITLNTIEKSNLEQGASRRWLGVNPLDVISSSQQKNTLDQLDYLKKAQPSIRVKYVEENQEVVRNEIPNHIRRLINAEALAIDSQNLSQSVGQKYSFLVGINHYRAGIGNLNYCINDVIDLGQTLQNLGYQTRILHDESEDENHIPIRSNIETALFDWTQALNPEDTLYVHFSCHGALIGDKAMLITNDTSIQRLTSTALDLQEVINIMKSGRAKKLVLSLDVCHGGVDMGRALVDREFVRNVYEKAEGFVLLAASTAQQQAYEVPEHQHGLFTYFIIQGLNGEADDNDDGMISTDDLRNYTLDHIRLWNANHGGFQEPTYRAEGIGEILLVHPER